MKLQSKLGLLMLIAWLLILAIIIIQSFTVALKNYQRLELADINQTYQRFSQAMAQRNKTIRSSTSDWANWTETYKFINKKNNAFINSNLVPSTAFENINVNYILFLDNKGAFYEGRAFNLQTKQFYPVPKSLKNAINKMPLLKKHAGANDIISGFVLSGRMPILLSSIPITDDQKKLTPNGNVIMGYDFNDYQLQIVQEIIQASIRLIIFDDSVENSMASIINQLKQGAPYTWLPVNDKKLFVYVPLFDIEHQLKGLFQITMPRTIYLVGLHSIYQSIYIVVFSGILILLLTGLLIRRYVLSPLVHYKNQLNEITKTKNFSQPIVITGSGEISDLAKDSNIMLETISSTQNKLTEQIDTVSNTNQQLKKESTAREAAEKKLNELYSKMIIASRRAGMADVAISILHNIGNSLNSVNVSATLIHEQIMQSELDRIGPLAQLLEAHRENLEEYLRSDPKGKQIPTFLNLLSEKWQNKKTFLLKESKSMQKHIEHIKKIVASQQNASTNISVKEPCTASSLMDDALHFCERDINLSAIIVNKEYANLPDLFVDKVKILQILVNLIKNAIESLTDSTRIQKTITVAVKEVDKYHFCMEVRDNGLGIDKEHLKDLFTFGFHMKDNGHGIGLHSSSNSTRELGGRLYATSEGIDKGATFVVVLPY